MSLSSLKYQLNHRIELSLVQMEKKGVEIRKQEMSFARQWTHGNLPVRNPDVMEWHRRTLHQKRQI